MPSYCTHDNGGNPFKVDITAKRSGFRVKVYQVKFDEQKNEYNFETSKCFLTIVVPRVFVARESDAPPKRQQSKYFYHEDGHVVVLEVNSHESVYIGERVYKFKTLAKLERLESFIGNSDVPYPCVVDQDHNVYLLLENKIIKHMTRKAFGNSTDIYDFYYHNKIPKERLQAMETTIIRDRDCVIS